MGAHELHLRDDADVDLSIAAASDLDGTVYDSGGIDVDPATPLPLSPLDVRLELATRGDLTVRAKMRGSAEVRELAEEDEEFLTKS